MKQALLQGRGLCKTFPRSGGDALILDHVGVDLYEGDFTVIMGPSGAGKSTLLYALGGMDSITGGEAQRAAIARATINDPGLLFADEPTGALNKRSSQEVLDLLSDLNGTGQSVLMVTHDVRSTFRGNRILYLEDGRILDELELSVYRGEAGRDREAKVTDWLSALHW